ncbi:phosphoenolpyruvate carboxylase, partial [Candidatus Microgenomates bacterium]
IEVIPIFESVQIILSADTILDDYITLSQDIFHEKVSYMRPFLARSDPALNSGIVATTLAIKWALSQFAKLSTRRGIPLYPIIAPGALPFRGGLTPETTQEFLDEFAGIRTLVIQSAFRYDFDKADVAKAIKKIQAEMPHLEARLIEPELFPYFLYITNLFEKSYRETVEQMALFISQVSHFIPARRERMQHIGLFGYSRRVGENLLPRAIGFTAASYSLGIPAELFGLGKAIKQAQKEGYWNVVTEYYPSLKSHITRAGKFFRRQSLEALNMIEMEKELPVLEEFTGEPLGPVTASENEHAKLIGQIIDSLKNDQNPQDFIEQAAVLRKSLG